MPVYPGALSGTPFWAPGVADGIFNPNCATAFDTQGSEPYGLLRLMAYGGRAVNRRTSDIDEAYYPEFLL